ncbi:MAG: alpha/beta fold hydrolase [Nevskiaceae bacterium]|nr:MAG: alpha/beta fold hydrolase [Nevskiaceae bacterium]TBR71369.1 MAG: alpha/beta fold hydrolase [Nevskiaceae bacterium]
MSARIDVKLDAGTSIPGAAAGGIAASAWLPAEPERARFVLACLPGGYMNRHYFDLVPPNDTGNGTYSFAAQMTARGHVVVALDHPGIGASTPVEDGYALTPEVVAQADVNAIAAVMARLRTGTLADGVPPMPELRSIGVGHSMGAMLTVLLQARFRFHAGVALLGFSTRGLARFLPTATRTLPYAEQRARLVALARSYFVTPWPALQPGAGGAELYGSARAERAGVAALRGALDRLLPVPAYLAMVAGNVAPEAAQIDVPVFLGVGDRDLTGPPAEIPAAFPAAPNVELEVLPETGHSHFLFPSRARLFGRLDGWLKRQIGN